MGYRCYFKGQTPDNIILDELCLGKCYGYNEYSDGLMLGYLDIMQTEAYKEYRKDENLKEYTDYEIIDFCFIARGSIDMHLLTEDFEVFLDHYYPTSKTINNVFVILLSRINEIPLCTRYNDIRSQSLKKIIYPRDVVMASKLNSSLDVREKCRKEAIPEFLRFNIVESEIGNVY